MHGAERTGAGGVDDAIGAAEVEAVGDAAGGDIAEQAGKGVLLPGNVGVGNALDDVIGGLGIDAGFVEGAFPDRMAEAGAEGDDQLQRPGHAEDDAGAVAVEVPRAVSGIAGVGEGLLGGDEAEDLGGVRGLDVLGRNAEFQRIEVDRVQKAAALGVGHVRSLGVAVKIILGGPVGLGDVVDGVDAVLDVGPIGFGVPRFGEHAGKADDGDRLVIGRAIFGLRFLLLAHSDNSDARVSGSRGRQRAASAGRRMP